MYRGMRVGRTLAARGWQVAEMPADDKAEAILALQVEPEIHRVDPSFSSWSIILTENPYYCY